MDDSEMASNLPQRDEMTTGRERRKNDRRSASPASILRQIVERLPDGVVIVSETGSIRFANPAAEQLFGRSARDLVGVEFGYPLAAGEHTEIEVVRRQRGGERR